MSESMFQVVNFAGVKDSAELARRFWPAMFALAKDLGCELGGGEGHPGVLYFSTGSQRWVQGR